MVLIFYEDHVYLLVAIRSIEKSLQEFVFT